MLLFLTIPLFIGLGMWQLDRADQKREQARVLSSRSRLPAFDLGAEVVDGDSLRFRTLRARGSYEAPGQILLENRREGGRNGYHVITPLRIADSKLRVLVNRGWIPAAADGSPTPAPVPSGIVTVAGEAYLPSAPALVLHGDAQAARGWGERWPYLTVDLYAKASGYALQPVVILLSAKESGGFARHWQRELPKEGMHIGYAIQWFAFALIALTLWLRLSMVKAPDSGMSA